MLRYNTDAGKELNKQLTAGPVELEVTGNCPAPADKVLRQMGIEAATPPGS